MWALGPICHVVSHAVELVRPIPHVGHQGSWPIDESVRAGIREQIGEGQAILRTWDLAELGPTGEAPQSLAHVRPANSSLSIVGSSRGDHVEYFNGKSPPTHNVECVGNFRRLGAFETPVRRLWLYDSEFLLWRCSNCIRSMRCGKVDSKGTVA